MVVLFIGVELAWLHRTSYEGQKCYCPQVGDTVVYVPKPKAAHMETYRDLVCQLVWGGLKLKNYLRFVLKTRNSETTKHATGWEMRKRVREPWCWLRVWLWLIVLVLRESYWEGKVLNNDEEGASTRSVVLLGVLRVWLILTDTSSEWIKAKSQEPRAREWGADMSRLWWLRGGFAVSEDKLFYFCGWACHRPIVHFGSRCNFPG